ncbi:PREDICTED: neprilysin-11-like, partial [Priapulus caudatus]|uniref:Neprilysin-11-like n=1 Tax=Priapulus caudatus TaxID=37621 RepID=A0ABM1EKK7_PRICU
RVDELSDEPVTAYLAGVNLSTSWPVLADEWNESDFRLTELLARLRRDAASVIYHVAVVTDNRNSTRHILAIDQASLGLSRKYLLDTEQFEKYVNSYRQYMEQVAGILRASDNVTNVTSEIQQIIDFETDLANVTLEDNSRRNRTRLYNLRTVRNVTASFSASVQGVQAESPRWLTCMGITLRRLPMAMGYIYVNRTFSEQSKVTALELIREIKESFKQRVATVEWMSDKTKRAAIEKIDAVIDKIGYPDFIRNLTLLDQRYDRNPVRV